MGMRNVTTGAAFCLLAAGIPGAADAQEPAGVELADLSWIEAEELLTADAVVVIPLGAASKEHGPQLRLDNDFVMAEYLRDRVLAESDVVIAPTINYHFYPSFLEYPGSTHLTFETARDVVVDIVRSLAGYGPTRFYVLNTGVSTLRPLRASAEVLAADGVLLRFTNILEVAGEAEERVKEQVRGTHADEIETSMMLYIAPDRVDMSLAVKEDNPNRPGGLTRSPDGEGTYSVSGIWGDPTLATLEKGRIVVEATVEGILADIEALRAADPAPPELLGDFVDDYGIRYAIGPDSWAQLPDGELLVSEWRPREGFLIGRAEPGQDGAPGAGHAAASWTRVDWVRLDDGGEWEWAFCYAAYDATSSEEARAAPASARETPRTGCNGFPFSRMKRAEGG